MNSDQLRIFTVIQKACDQGIKSGATNSGRDWLKSHNLTHQKTFAVMNSGQLSQHKDQPFLDNLLLVGFITPSKRPQNAFREKAYTPFAKGSVMFPWRDKDGNVVNYCAYIIKDSKSVLLNDMGVYPCYPAESTSRLFIAPSVLDAAAMLEAKALRSREAVIGLHNGVLLPVHLNAIQELQYLKEIIVIDK